MYVLARIAAVISSLPPPLRAALVPWGWSERNRTEYIGTGLENDVNAFWTRLCFYVYASLLRPST